MDEYMWVVLYCPGDDSHVLVDEQSLIFDGELSIEDSVKFAFSSCKDFIFGVVKGMSNDYDEMNKLMQKLNSKTKPKREPSFHEDRPRQAAVKCKLTNLPERSSYRRKSASKKEQTKSVSTSGPAVHKTLTKTQKSSPSKSQSKVQKVKHHSLSSSDEEENTPLSKFANETLIKDTTKDNSTVGNFSDVNDSDSSGNELTPAEAALLLKLNRKRKREDFKKLASLVNKNKTADLKQCDINVVTKKPAAPAQLILTEKLNITSTSCAGVTLGEVSPSQDDHQDESPPYSTICGASKSGNDHHSIKQGTSTRRKLPSTSAFSSTTDEDSCNQEQSKAKKPKRKRIVNRQIVEIKYEGEHFEFKETDSIKVVRLTPSYNVFIGEKALKKVKVTTSTSTALARALLRVIFKKEARDVCSVSGKRSFSSKGVVEVRTPLDSDGIEAILEYVKNRAIKKNWPAPNPAFLKQAMGNTLSDGRASVPCQDC